MPIHPAVNHRSPKSIHSRGRGGGGLLDFVQYSLKLTLRQIGHLVSPTLKSYPSHLLGMSTSRQPYSFAISPHSDRHSAISFNISIAQYYISLLPGILNIDDQYRSPNINNRDHLAGQLNTTGLANHYSTHTTQSSAAIMQLIQLLGTFSLSQKSSLKQSCTLAAETVIPSYERAL